MKILVTDSSLKHALGVVRCLAQHGYTVKVTSLTQGSLCARSKYCHGEILIPGYDDETFEDIFLGILEHHDLDLVIPVGTGAFERLVPLKNKIEQHAIMVTVEKEILDICLSKKRIYQVAENISIPIPKTFYPQTITELDEMKNQMTYPCVIKGLYEVGDNIVDYADNQDELIHTYNRMCKKYHFTSENGLPLIQEYIPGDGCGFFAVYNYGKCGATFQHHRLREMPPSGGFSVAAESFRNNLVQAYGKKLLDHMEWHGVAMVEFKMNAENQPVLMEVNPKFWGSLDLPLAAGVYFPVELVKIAKGKKIDYSDEYQYPFKYHWPLHGDLEHAISNPKKSINVLMDCLNPNVQSNVWLIDDFGATRWMLYIFIVNIVKKILVKILPGFFIKRIMRSK